MIYKTNEELYDMNRDERIKHFRSMTKLELKKYFYRVMKQPAYGDLQEVYQEKRGK